MNLSLYNLWEMSSEWTCKSWGVVGKFELSEIQSQEGSDGGLIQFTDEKYKFELNITTTRHSLTCLQNGNNLHRFNVRISQV